MQFPARFTPEAAGFSVTFRDVPEAITQGDTLPEARSMAIDALRTAVEFYAEDGRPLPTPSPLQPGEELVTLFAPLAGSDK